MLPPDDPNTVADLAEKVFGGETFEHGPERLLQNILIECAVKPSAELNLLGDTQKLTLAALNQHLDAQAGITEFSLLKSLD